MSSAGASPKDLTGAAALALLRLHVEWGADEALGERPVDRTAPAAPPAAQLGERPALRPAAGTPARPAVAARTQERTQERAQALAAAAGDLAQLDAALAAFDGCALRATATTLVQPSGNPAAGLVLIGEAPGPEDDRAATAFAGPLGALLDRMLASIGVDRTSVLLTTLVPWRPPGNRAPTETEVQACLPFLLRRLELIRPRRLVLLGGPAARALTGATESARRLRGRWRPAAVPGLDAPIPALPMLPLEQVARSPALKQATWSDLLTLRRALNTD